IRQIEIQQLDGNLASDGFQSAKGSSAGADVAEIPTSSDQSKQHEMIPQRHTILLHYEKAVAAHRPNSGLKFCDECIRPESTCICPAINRDLAPFDNENWGITLVVLVHPRCHTSIGTVQV